MIKKTNSDSTNSINLQKTDFEDVKNTKDVSYKPSLCKRIAYVYKERMQQFSRFLEKHNWHITAKCITYLWYLSVGFGSFFVEPWQTIKINAMRPLSWKKEFDFYGMNPTVLSEEQEKKQPILLIHGNTLDESSWISLAKKLKDKNLGPVFTVKVPVMSSNLMHCMRHIEEKIDEIKSKYKHFNQINLIGHSSGAALAQLSRFYPSDVNKIIKMGDITDCGSRGHLKNIYEITGTYDIMETSQSSLPLHKQYSVNTGHLGMLFSGEVHDRIIEWLS